MNIKSSIGIIAIVISSISAVEAGQKRHQEDRYTGNHQSSSYERQGNNWRHAKRYRQARGHRSWKRVHSQRRYYRDNGYRQHSYYRSSPRVTHNITVNADPLVPIIVGGIIAKKIIRHDPIIRNILRYDPIARAIFGH